MAADEALSVAEPHHDGTPQWHLLLFLRPEEVEYATAIFRKHAMREDGQEPGAQDHRFIVKPIDEQFGSATGYIAKYISKNIDGYGMDGELDLESGQPVMDMAKRVRAWASRWNIRQFQQIGGAPVTTWRELRRLGDRELVLHPELEAARAAADAPDWPGYTNAQGGPFVARDCLRVRLNYEFTENGNDYGDMVAKITGVYCPYTSSESVIFTRTTDYKIVPKRKPSPVEVLTLQGRAAAPWSSVNNCTRDPATGVDGLEHADHEVGVTVNIDSLSRQEKRELAQRLSDDVRSKRKKRSPGREEGAGLSVKEQQINELLVLRGIDASVGMIKSLIAGAHIGYGDLIFAVKDGRLTINNRLDAGFEVATKQKMANILDRDRILERLKKAFYVK